MANSGGRLEYKWQAFYDPHSWYAELATRVMEQRFHPTHSLRRSFPRAMTIDRKCKCGGRIWGQSLSFDYDKKLEKKCALKEKTNG